MKYVLMSGSYRETKIYDEIIDFINENLKTEKKIAFIASTFEAFDKNDYYSQKLLEAFQEKNMCFDENYIIDNRCSNDEMIRNINDSNIIFIMGGDTLEQIKNINKYNLKEYINSNDKIVIGMSAGSINMAKKVVLAKDEEDNIPELSIYNGIGITDLNIEPHCDFKNKEHWKEIEEASQISDIIVMNDDCFIIGDNDNIKYYGSYIILKKSKIFYKDIECDLETFLKEIN